MSRTLLTLVSLVGGIAIAASLMVGGTILAGDRTLFGTRSATGENTRACVMHAASTPIACTTAASASSSALNVNSRYLIQCGDDSYVTAGTSSPTASATSYTFIAPKWAIVDFATDDSAQYMACLNINSSTGCRVWECL
jgi:hypothetical protein